MRKIYLGSNLPESGRNLPDVRIIITHSVPGYAHRTVHGMAWDATDEEVEGAAAQEVMGCDFAPFGTRELIRSPDGMFSIIVHTD